MRKDVLKILLILSFISCNKTKVNDDLVILDINLSSKYISLYQIDSYTNKVKYFDSRFNNVGYSGNIDVDIINEIYNNDYEIIDKKCCMGKIFLFKEGKKSFKPIYTCYRDGKSFFDNSLSNIIKVLRSAQYSNSFTIESNFLCNNLIQVLYRYKNTIGDIQNLIYNLCRHNERGKLDNDVPKMEILPMRIFIFEHYIPKSPLGLSVCMKEEDLKIVRFYKTNDEYYILRYGDDTSKRAEICKSIFSIEGTIDLIKRYEKQNLLSIKNRRYDSITDYIFGVSSKDSFQIYKYNYDQYIVGSLVFYIMDCLYDCKNVEIEYDCVDYSIMNMDKKYLINLQ